MRGIGLFDLEFLALIQFSVDKDVHAILARDPVRPERTSVEPDGGVPFFQIVVR